MSPLATIDRAAVVEWLETFEAVRAAQARGFVPFGNAWNHEMLMPGSVKFSYPAGGIAHPHHADGLAAGAWFWVWTFSKGKPDELAGEPVWIGGPTSPCQGPWGLRRESPGNMTLDRALGYVEAYAAHYRRHCIVPEVARTDTVRAIYSLTAREWGELRDGVPNPEGLQIGLFDDPLQGPYASCRRAIRDELAARPVEQDARVALRDGMWSSQLQSLIDLVNHGRAVPPFCGEGEQT